MSLVFPAFQKWNLLEVRTKDEIDAEQGRQILRSWCHYMYIGSIIQLDVQILLNQ